MITSRFESKRLNRSTASLLGCEDTSTGPLSHCQATKSNPWVDKGTMQSEDLDKCTHVQNKLSVGFFTIVTADSSQANVFLHCGENEDAPNHEEEENCAGIT